MHLLQNTNHVQGVPELHGGDICTFCTPNWTQEQAIFDNHSFTSLGSKFLTYFDSPVYVEKKLTLVFLLDTFQAKTRVKR